VQNRHTIMPVFRRNISVSRSSEMRRISNMNRQNEETSGNIINIQRFGHISGNFNSRNNNRTTQQFIPYNISGRQYSEYNTHSIQNIDNSLIEDIIEDNNEYYPNFIDTDTNNLNSIDYNTNIINNIDNNKCFPNQFVKNTDGSYSEYTYSDFINKNQAYLYYNDTNEYLPISQIV